MRRQGQGIRRGQLRRDQRLSVVAGAGLGLRRDFIAQLADGIPPDISFFEVAPENWMKTGGRMGRAFRALTERHPFVAHGLSLSLGGPAPLDLRFVKAVGRFLDAHGIRLYSEHLSWCADDGQLYELFPIPFTGEAVRHVAARIRRVQDVLGRQIAIENVSYYVAPGAGASLSEASFLAAVLEEADCGLLLDVNNIEVNAANHGYDPAAFLDAIPAGRVRYLHIAGHEKRAPDLRIDTHGEPVSAAAWKLLARAYARFGALPTVLERDFNIPPLPQLCRELARVRRLQAASGAA